MEKSKKSVKYILVNTFFNWISGWIGLLDGLGQILTLGIFCPNMEYKYCMWKMKVFLKWGLIKSRKAS